MIMTLGDLCEFKINFPEADFWLVNIISNNFIYTYKYPTIIKGHKKERDKFRTGVPASESCERGYRRLEI